MVKVECEDVMGAEVTYEHPEATGYARAGTFEDMLVLINADDDGETVAVYDWNIVRRILFS